VLKLAIGNNQEFFSRAAFHQLNDRKNIPETHINLLFLFPSD
jgi:hypothetical protein